MYSPVRLSVNGPKMGTAAFFVMCVVLGLTAFQATQDELSPTISTRPLSCDAVLTTLFTPARPQLGRYEVCTSREPLTAVARPGWRIEMLPPLDAFGAAGPYDRAALSRLYGGRRVGVARGWTEEGNRFESLTLISPYPDATLSRLMPGTLVIRHAIIR
jgi:hypothetical protein